MVLVVVVEGVRSFSWDVTARFDRFQWQFLRGGTVLQNDTGGQRPNNSKDRGVLFLNLRFP